MQPFNIPTRQSADDPDMQAKQIAIFYSSWTNQSKYRANDEDSDRNVSVDSNPVIAGENNVTRDLDRQRLRFRECWWGS